MFPDLDRDESDRGVKYRSYFGNAYINQKRFKKIIHSGTVEYF